MLTRVCLLQLPYFMNELTLTELDMGSTTPRILRASKPSIDYRGKGTNIWRPKHTQMSTEFYRTRLTRRHQHAAIVSEVFSAHRKHLDLI